jgi:hypothetical protein
MFARKNGPFLLMRPSPGAARREFEKVLLLGAVAGLAVKTYIHF